LKWTGPVACRERYAYNREVGKPEGRRPFGRSTHRGENMISKTFLKK
jgi:hypothetical protein